MKRKALAIMLVLVVLMSACLPAFADSAVASCLSKNNYRKAQQIVSSANLRILACVRTAQFTPYDDVAWMLRTTKAIASDAKYRVQRLGYEIYCEYVNYYVDGRWVEVDPLHVVNPLDPKPDPDTKD